MWSLRLNYDERCQHRWFRFRDVYSQQVDSDNSFKGAQCIRVPTYSRNGFCKKSIPKNFLSVFLMNSSSLMDSSFWKRPFSRRTISLCRTFSFSRTCLYFGKILPIKDLLFLEEPSLSQNISSSFRKTLPKNYYSVKNFFFLKSLSFLKNSLFRKNSHFPKNSFVLKKLFVSQEPFLLLTSSLRNLHFHKNSFSLNNLS